MKRTRLDSKHEGILINRTDAAKLIGLPRYTIMRMETVDKKLTPIRLRKAHNSKVYYRRDEVLALIKVVKHECTRA